MRKTTLKSLGLFALVLGFAFVLPQRAAADEDDPPGRVARLSSARGSVSFNPAGTDDWVDAVVNRPMTTGDKLWADRGARAELHIGSASLRISGNTGFSFLNLTDETTQLQLTEGTLRVRVKRLSENETFEIDTPNLAFSVLRPGTYELNVNQAGDSTVVQVRSGEGEVTGGGSAYTVHASETGVFSGLDQLSADIDRRGFDDDDFDRWCGDRDRHEDRAISARYVSDDVIGYDDLDDYGGWRPVPEYGNVWFPHVTVVGWAPYRYGHWVWISPWGWTWVDDEPWGFAPFHYGRWVVVGGVWGWVPCGPRAVVGVAYVRPVYAPALVAWVGGPHFSVGIGVGGGGPVGWFPLGPREVYVPSYRVSRTYVTNVNVSNTTVNNVTVNNYYNNVIVNKNVNVTNVNYVNRTAVTATSGRTFTSAQPVGRNMVRVDAREVANAPVVATTPGVAPQQRSVLGAGGEARVRPPAAMQTRVVVAKTAPPPPPAPFIRQQQAIQANGGHPIAASETRQLAVESKRPEHPNVRVAAPPRQGMPPNVQAGRPPAQNPPPNTQAPVQSQQPGNPNRPNSVDQNRAPQGPQGNAPPQQPANPRGYRDRPPSSRPDGANAPNAQVDQRPQQRGEQQRVNEERQRQIDQKQQQQLEQLRQKQDQERQRIEQQQQQQQQKIQQQRANDDRQRQTQQKQQQQLEQLERKHDQEQQKLQQRQQQERARQESRPPSKPQKQDKQDKQPKDDRPHN
jgi:hypothetical protein